MTKKEAEKHRSYHCPSWREVADQIPQDLGEMGAKAKTSKKDWKWQRGVTSHPVSEGDWKKSHLTVWRWESEKAKKVGVFQLKVFGTMSPPMALRWESQAGGARAAGRWCRPITTRRCGLCTGCTERWMPMLRCGVHQKSGASGLPVPHQES